MSANGVFRGFLSITVVIVLLLPSLTFSQTNSGRWYSKKTLLERITSDEGVSTKEIEDIIAINKVNAPDSVYYNTLVVARDYFSEEDINQKTVKYGNEAIRLAKKLKRWDDLPRHYNVLAQPLNVLGEYEKQYQYAVRANHYAQKSKDTIQWIIAIAQTGTFYWHIDELELAVQSNKKAFQLCAKYPDFDRRAILLNNRATYYYANDRFQEAINCLNQAVPLCKTNYDTILVYNGLGTVYYLMDSIQKSHQYFDLSYQSVRGDANKQINRNYLFYKGLCAFKEEDFNTAKSLLIEAVELLNLSSSYQDLQESYETLYEIALIQNQKGAALTYLQMANKYRDTLEKNQNVKELARKNYNKNLLIKEREKAAAKRLASALHKKVEAEKNARLYSTIMMIVSIVGFVILVFWGINYRKLQRLKQEKMQRQFSNKMELKNKELASVHIRNIDRSNYMREVDSRLTEISGKIEKQQVRDNDELSHQLRTIKRNLKLNSREEWDDFRYYFEQLNESFFARIRELHPKVTANDEKIIAYIKVGLDSKQISRLLNVTQNTVRTQKYRLRKKMNLEEKADIRRYLDTISVKED